MNPFDDEHDIVQKTLLQLAWEEAGEHPEFDDSETVAAVRAEVAIHHIAVQGNSDD